MKNLTTLAATILASWGVCTSVWADTLLEPRSVTVHFEDLDINSTPGVATLYKPDPVRRRIRLQRPRNEPLARYISGAIRLACTALSASRWRESIALP